MNISEFTRGLRVLYLPGIAYGDRSHPACETGTVSSTNERFVFVKFDKQLNKFGWAGTTSQACDPSDLISLKTNDVRWSGEWKGLLLP